MAADTIREPFAVINADDFYGAEAYRLLSQYFQSGSSDQAMVGFVLRRTLSSFGTVSRGICTVDESDYLVSVEEMTRLESDGTHVRNTDGNGQVTHLSGDELVSMNLWGFTPQVFPWLRSYFEDFLKRSGTDLNAECFLPSMVNDLVSDGTARVRVLRTDDSWFGMTYREDRPRVVASIKSLIQQGHYPESLG